jgi:hypothetical protein
MPFWGTVSPPLSRSCLLCFWARVLPASTGDRRRAFCWQHLVGEVSHRTMRLFNRYRSPPRAKTNANTNDVDGSSSVQPSASMLPQVAPALNLTAGHAKLDGGVAGDRTDDVPLERPPSERPPSTRRPSTARLLPQPSVPPAPLSRTLQPGPDVSSATLLQGEVERLRRDTKRLRLELARSAGEHASVSRSNTAGRRLVKGAGGSSSKLAAPHLTPPQQRQSPPHHKRPQSSIGAERDPRWDVDGFASWAKTHAPFVRARVLRALLRHRLAVVSAAPLTVPEEELVRNVDDLRDTDGVAGVQRYVVLTSYFALSDPHPIATLREIVRVLDELQARGGGDDDSLVYWDQLSLTAAKRKDALCGEFYPLFTFCALMPPHSAPAQRPEGPATVTNHERVRTCW